MYLNLIFLRKFYNNDKNSEKLENCHTIFS